MKIAGPGGGFGEIAAAALNVPVGCEELESRVIKKLGLVGRKELREENNGGGF